MSLDAPSPQDSQQLLLYKIAVATGTTSTSTNTPTADQRAALDAADAPSAENPFITASGLPAATTTTAGIVTLASVGAFGYATTGAITNATLADAGVSLGTDLLATRRLVLKNHEDTRLLDHELGYVSLDQIGSLECTFQIGTGMPMDTVVSRYGVGSSNGDWRVGINNGGGESFRFTDYLSAARLTTSPVGLGSGGYGFEFSPYGGSGNAALGADSGFLVGYGDLGAQLASGVGSSVTADAQGVSIMGAKIVCALPSSAITALDKGYWSVAMDGSVPKLFYRPSNGALTSVSLGNYVNAQTGTTYTTASTDNGGVVTLSNGSATVVTLSNIPANGRVIFEQLGAGQVTFVAGGGNTLRHVAGLTKIAGQWGRALLRVAANGTDYILSGDMS